MKIKLNQKEVIAKIFQGMTQKEIAKEFNVTQPAISACIKNLKFCPHCNKPLYKLEVTNE